MTQHPGTHGETLAFVDLASGSVVVEAAPRKDGEAGFGGAAMGRLLWERHRDRDPLVLSTGPLTGGMAPGSCLLAATFAGADGGLRHAPFLLRVGPACRLSGIDHVVMTGKAAGPACLELDRGAARLRPVPDLAGRPVSQVLARLLGPAPDPWQVVVATGPAADKGSPLAGVVAGQALVPDRAALGPRLAAMGLKALLFTGWGRLPRGPRDLSLGQALVRSVLDQCGPKTPRFGLVLERLGPEGGAASDKSLRPVACHHCPVACLGFAGDAAVRGQGGLLLADHEGFVAMAEAAGDQVLDMLLQCRELGLDAAAAGAALEQAGPGPRQLEPLLDRDAPDSRPLPAKDSTLRRIFLGPEAGSRPPEPGTAEHRAAAAMVLGICPVLAALCPGLEPAAFLSFLGQEDVSGLEAGLEQALGFLFS